MVKKERNQGWGCGGVGVWGGGLLNVKSQQEVVNRGLEGQ